MSAVISKCGTYPLRALARAAARARERRCKAFAAREGFDKLAVANLYGLRSTHPQDLYTVSDPVGPENDSYVAGLANDADKVIVAWGFNSAPSIKGRIATVAQLLRRVHPELHCLGTTDGGQPRHPLMLPRDVDLEIWEPRL